MRSQEPQEINIVLLMLGGRQTSLTAFSSLSHLSFSLPHPLIFLSPHSIFLKTNQTEKTTKEPQLDL